MAHYQPDELLPSPPRGAIFRRGTNPMPAIAERIVEAGASGPLPEIDESAYAEDAVALLVELDDKAAEAAAFVEANEPEDDEPELEPVDFDELVHDATIAEIKANIEAGDWVVADVVAAESRGRNRATVLALK
jgi:hypothetical protein